MTGDEVYGALSGEIDDVKNLINQKIPEDVYGFIEHQGIMDPPSRVEYIGKNKFFNPISIDLTNHTYELGDWRNFNFLVQNKPYMVKSSGIVDYELLGTNYNYKADGKTASDVANASYDGGAFSWATRIYKNEYNVGNDRYVLFSDRPRDGFSPKGFVNENGKVLPGRWIPMFYGSINSNGKAQCIAGTQPSTNRTTDQEHTAITKFASNAKFFGGSFVETLIDLIILLTKTSNADVLGKGNQAGYVNDSSKYYGVLANAVVGGGQFYGSDDGKSLNKIFHSIVLGTYQQWMRDPYELVVNGRVKVSKNYTYDPTGAAYSDAGISTPDNLAWNSDHDAVDYPTYYQAVDGYGSIPAGTMAGGSTETGGCDGLWRYDPKITRTAVCLRFGDCTLGGTCGPRARDWYYVAGIAGWDAGFALLLDPPADVAA